MKQTIIGAVVGAAVAVLAVIGLHAVAPQLLGDFAGGIAPSQLLTANVSASSLTPVLSNFYVPGTISYGGTAVANQTVQQYTATTSYPSAAAVTLGNISQTSSTASTTVSIPFGGFSTGDPCSEIYYNGVPPSGNVSFDANITTSTASAATATVLFMNVAGANVTFNTTSSYTGASSTLKLTCRHAGV